MSRFASEYAIPSDLDTDIDDGFLELIAEKPDEKTVEFHIPSQRWSDDKGSIASYSVIWINPPHNAEFCHFFVETRGDLPNFYVSREFSRCRCRVHRRSRFRRRLGWLAERAERNRHRSLNAWNWS